MARNIALLPVVMKASSTTQEADVETYLNIKFVYVQKGYESGKLWQTYDFSSTILPAQLGFVIRTLF